MCHVTHKKKHCHMKRGGGKGQGGAGGRGRGGRPTRMKLVGGEVGRGIGMDGAGGGGKGGGHEVLGRVSKHLDFK